MLSTISTSSALVPPMVAKTIPRALSATLPQIVTGQSHSTFSSLACRMGWKKQVPIHLNPHLRGHLLVEAPPRKLQCNILRPTDMGFIRAINTNAIPGSDQSKLTADNLYSKGKGVYYHPDMSEPLDDRDFKSRHTHEKNKIMSMDDRDFNSIHTAYDYEDEQFESIPLDERDFKSHHPNAYYARQVLAPNRWIFKPNFVRPADGGVIRAINTDAIPELGQSKSNAHRTPYFKGEDVDYPDESQPLDDRDFNSHHTHKKDKIVPMDERDFNSIHNPYELEEANIVHPADRGFLQAFDASAFCGQDQTKPKTYYDAHYYFKGEDVDNPDDSEPLDDRDFNSHHTHRKDKIMPLDERDFNSIHRPYDHEDERFESVPLDERDFDSHHQAQPIKQGN